MSLRHIKVNLLSAPETALFPTSGFLKQPGGVLSVLIPAAVFLHLVICENLMIVSML